MPGMVDTLHRVGVLEGREEEGEAREGEREVDQIKLAHHRMEMNQTV
jgi:hypothetical protein